MFSNRIANSAKFLQMPEGSQLLYFHMVLRADDDGVVEAYPVMTILGSQPDNLKVLITKGFIRQLNEDQVMVILDWTEHNTIRADRKVNSIYIDLIKEKAPEVEILEPKPRIDVEDNSKRVRGLSTDGIGKVRLGKERKKESFPTFVGLPIKPSPTEKIGERDFASRVSVWVTYTHWRRRLLLTKSLFIFIKAGMDKKHAIC